MIRLELTKEEYRELLEMVYVAEWVRNARREEGDPKTWPYRAAEQKVYRLAKEAGLSDLVDDDDPSGELSATSRLDDIGQEVLGGHDDDAFWDNLIERLAIRDVERQKGRGALEKMTPEARAAAIDQAQERYQREFADHGLDRLEIRGGGR